MEARSAAPSYLFFSKLPLITLALKIADDEDGFVGYWPCWVSGSTSTASGHQQSSVWMYRTMHLSSYRAPVLSLRLKEMMLTVATKKLKQGPTLRSLESYFYFLSNNYLGLSSHPTVSKAVAKAALAHGMGPRGSILICGYTSYHGLLESCLVDLKKKEVLTLFYVLQSIVHWESGSFVHFINLLLHLLTEKINLFFSVVLTLAGME